MEKLVKFVRLARVEKLLGHALLHDLDRIVNLNGQMLADALDVIPLRRPALKRLRDCEIVRL